MRDHIGFTIDGDLNHVLQGHGAPGYRPLCLLALGTRDRRKVGNELRLSNLRAIHRPGVLHHRTLTVRVEHEVELASALVTHEVPRTLYVLTSTVPEALSLELDRVTLTATLVVHGVLVGSPEDAVPLSHPKNPLAEEGVRSLGLTVLLVHLGLRGRHEGDEGGARVVQEHFGELGEGDDLHVFPCPVLLKLL